MVLPRGAPQLLPHHVQLAGQRARLQRAQLLLGQPERQLVPGVLHQRCRGDPVVLCGLVRDGQVGAAVGTVLHHDVGRIGWNMLHVRANG